MSRREPEETDPIPEVRGLLYLIAPLGVLALIWGWFLIEHFTDVRFHPRGRGNALALDNRPLPLAIPLIATPLIAAGGYVFWRRARLITSRGQWAKATIISFGLAMKGQQDVTLEYHFGSKKYRKRRSIDDSVVEHKQPGDYILIIVDQKNPKRFHVPNIANSKLPKRE